MTEVIVTIISGMLSICTILVTSLATSNKKLNNISTTLAVIEEKNSSYKSSYWRFGK